VTETEQTTTVSTDLDVRDVPKPSRHPLIFARFAALPTGGSVVLVNSHDPKHLRQEFDRDHAGAYDWDYLETGPVWRIRITRLATTELPTVLVNTQVLTASDEQTDAGGAIWKLERSERHLDANVIRLRPGATIELHAGPDLDVLMHVIAGTGQLTHEVASLQLSAGELLWLPRRSQRSIEAGPDGLSYLTVHPRRPGLSIGSGPGSPP
jgi:uncharacterized protein (DUF2249 family)